MVLIPPEGYNPHFYKHALYDLFLPRDSRFGHQLADFPFALATVGQKPNKIIADYEDDLRDKKRAILVAENREILPSIIRLVADAIVDLEPIAPRDLIAGARLFNKVELSKVEATQILEYPLDAVWAALRPGRSAMAVLQKLNENGLDSPGVPRKDAETPALDQMYGYGEAKDWGLELAQDLHDWQAGRIGWNDVDRGIVLSGAPGVGKTIYAKALAKQCGVKLIAASLSQWQSNGHLGDLLKAMRADFAKAKEQAPSILFIDELDSFGDRKSFSSDNKDYSTQVVNAFLEQLDGLDGREGVVVIGATNNPGNIDPAILRPGRLDRHVTIPLPNAEDRVQILNLLLNDAIEIKALQPLASRTHGMTGADLSKAVRDAKRIARRASRSVNTDDIAAALPAIVLFDDDYRHANAIHEAGHTVIGIELKVGEFVHTKLADHVVADRPLNTGGFALFDFPRLARRERQVYLDLIALSLGGMAAEELILGSPSDGAGLVAGSDLENATRLATILEAQTGLGSTLSFCPARSDKELEDIRRSDQKLRDRIELILNAQLGRAKSILMDNQDFLGRLANELLKTGILTPERAAELQKQVEPMPHAYLLKAS